MSPIHWTNNFPLLTYCRRIKVTARKIGFRKDPVFRAEQIGRSNTRHRLRESLMTDQKHYEKVLRDRLDELTDRLSDVEAELDKPSDPDSEDRAVEREGDEVLEGLGTAGLIEIRKIEAALDRIKEGTFGVCVACREQISNERLKVVPHAARCRDCA